MLFLVTNCYSGAIKHCQTINIAPRGPGVKFCMDPKDLQGVSLSDDDEIQFVFDPGYGSTRRFLETVEWARTMLDIQAMG